MAGIPDNASNANARTRRFLASPEATCSVFSSLVFFPPADIFDFRVRFQNLIEDLCHLADFSSRIDLFKKLSNDRLTGFDKAEISIGIFLVMPATYPHRECFILYGQTPAPIFWHEFLNLYSFGLQFFLQVLTKMFTPETRVDLFLFPCVRRKFI